MARFERIVARSKYLGLKLRRDLGLRQYDADLCEKCYYFYHLRIRDLYRKTLPKGEEIDLANDSDHIFTHGRPSECSMCQFFQSVAGPELRHGRMDTFTRLRVCPADDVFTNLGADKVIFDTNVLSIQNSFEPDNCQYLWLQGPRVRRLYGARLLDPGCFDIEATNHWISYCQSNHRATCRLGSLPRMQSFQVIDCKTETVIKAPPKCAYVALSYVWGEISTTDFPSSLGCAPKLILDSIEVTKMLKFRYLWVDRYCIDQSDSTGKHEQICQMDMIYASAQVTIIAAGSEDPNRGLHGVRGTLRIPQLILPLGNHRIVSSLVHRSDNGISRSKWATRGWTYQEGLLSTRRLVFSEDQVRFECNSMHCSEAIHLPLEEMHDKKTGKMDLYAPIGAFQWKDFAIQPWDFMNYVSQFSQRELSFPTDALNAMRGIFNNLEKGRYPVFQLMGVPIMPPYINTGYRGRTPNDLKCGRISRPPGAGFLIGLLWIPRLFKSLQRLRVVSWIFVKNIHLTYVALITGDGELTICFDFSADEMIRNENSFGLEPPSFGKSLTAIIFALTEDTSPVDYPVSVIIVDEESNKDFSRRVGICRRFRKIYVGKVTASSRLSDTITLLPNDYSRGAEGFKEIKKVEQQALIEWAERLPTRTIRLG
ncbi:Heterokaryon incompatibility protein [Rutstroemia sp. NJR-2017a WRK4]|nr:Heterokaryon incompatibility protein [Rutstroemia sp. NJR-2017a WRK4]